MASRFQPAACPQPHADTAAVPSMPGKITAFLCQIGSFRKEIPAHIRISAVVSRCQNHALRRSVQTDAAVGAPAIHTGYPHIFRLLQLQGAGGKEKFRPVFPGQLLTGFDSPGLQRHSHVRRSRPRMKTIQRLRHMRAWRHQHRMDPILFLLGQRCNQPVKGFPAMHRVGFDQWKKRTVACAQLPVIHKRIHIHRRDAMRPLPLAVDMSDLADAQHPLPVLLLLFQHDHTGTGFGCGACRARPGMPGSHNHDICLVNTLYLIRRDFFRSDSPRFLHMPHSVPSAAL